VYSSFAGLILMLCVGGEGEEYMRPKMGTPLVSFVTVEPDSLLLNSQALELKSVGL
jgi:hypothetical protein